MDATPSGSSVPPPPPPSRSIAPPKEAPTRTHGSLYPDDDFGMNMCKNPMLNVAKNPTLEEISEL